MSKDDVTISPFSGSVLDMKPAPTNSSKPVYLISLELDPGKKTVTYFLAMKVDRHDSCVEFRGHVTESPSDAEKNPHGSFDAQRTREIFVPWTRVVKIENISFKATK